MAITLLSERPEHAGAIEVVLARAFGPGRYAKTSERVRERDAAAEPSLSRVALDASGAVVGVCRIWRVLAGGAAYFLGPLAVDPSLQGGGVGADLVRGAVAACRASGGGAVIAIGAARFFEPLGFHIAPQGLLMLPGPVDPARVLILELRPGGLDAIGGAISGSSR